MLTRKTIEKLWTESSKNYQRDTDHDVRIFARLLEARVLERVARRHARHVSFWMTTALRREAKKSLQAAKEGK